MAPQYTKQDLYTLVTAPRSRVDPPALKKFADVYVPGTKGEEDVALRVRDQRADALKTKEFQASTVSFAEAAGVKPEVEAPERKKDAGKGSKGRGGGGKPQEAEEHHHHSDLGGGMGMGAKGGHYDRDSRDRPEDTDPGYKEWERSRFSPGNKWNAAANEKPISAKALETKLISSALPENNVDAMFAASEPSATSLSVGRTGGSRFMKHFQTQPEPFTSSPPLTMQAGGTEEEVLRKVQQQSQLPHYSTTLDAATFERQLIASHSQPTQPFKTIPASYVDAASLERQLLGHVQPVADHAPQQHVSMHEMKPAVASQQGTFDASALEQQLLASAIKANAVPPLVSYGQQQRGR